MGFRPITLQGMYLASSDLMPLIPLTVAWPWCKVFHFRNFAKSYAWNNRDVEYLCWRMWYHRGTFLSYVKIMSYDILSYSRAWWISASQTEKVWWWRGISRRERTKRLLWWASCSYWLLLLTYHVDSGSRPAQNSVNMQREVITGCPRPISVKVSLWCVYSWPLGWVLTHCFTDC